jgi:NTP pyrophosphatase (non-canonical NTP hydrolase)
MPTLKKLMKEAHQTAIDKGWWSLQSDGDRNFPEQLALMHSELSEVLEEFRKYGLDKEQFIYDTITTYANGFKHSKPDGIAAEFADLLIRVFDTCEKYEIPLEKALKVKMAYNKKRPFRHGGKKC